MKKTPVIIIAFTIICILLSNIAFAQNYTYFDVVKTDYPEENILSDNVVYVSNVYYMSGIDGGLYYSHDAKSWHFISGSDGARIICDQKPSSEALIVFYNGYLVKSYDGANFELLYTFKRDTVISYDRDLYIAYEKENAQDENAYVYFSFNAKDWAKLSSDKVIGGGFRISKYPDMYIINGIKTEGGIISAILNDDLSLHTLSYDYVSYDILKNIYCAVKSDESGAKLYFSPSLSDEFTPINLPVDSSTVGSYYDGSFYIASIYDDIFFNVYKCSDTKNWEESDIFYTPLYKTCDDEKNLCEAFLWHDSALNRGGVSLLKTSSDNKSSSSVILSDEQKLDLYGSALGISLAQRPLNLISTDFLTWHQADEASAFSILNSHSLRGKYMFLNKDDKTLLSPKGNPYDTLEKKGIEVCVDGNFIAFDSEPLIISSRTMVPLRAISESLGATVDYDDATRTITLSQGGNTIVTSVGSDKANVTYYDGALYEATLDSPSVIAKDRTLVPVRFISEVFNKNVYWIDDTKTVYIISK